MQEIDFLPAEYRRQYARRRQQPWRVLGVVVFLGALAATTFAQYRQCCQLESKLAAIAPERETASERKTELAQLQAGLASARAEAELITYLRHPWPRTQLIRALLAPLPEPVTLKTMRIDRQVAPGRQAVRLGSREERESLEEELQRMPPAARDLAQLRQECDGAPIQVSISGVTSESAALHAYLGELGRADLFLKAELHSLEANPSVDAGRLHFEALILVRPGYGQAGGPTDADRNLPAASPANQVGARLRPRSHHAL